MAARPSYDRVLLKLSGAAFGSPESPLDASRVDYLAREIASVRAAGTACAVVAGGGNVIRGRQALAMGWPHAAVDYMGMVATVVNGLALKEALTARGLEAAVKSAFAVGEAAEICRPQSVGDDLADGKTIIFVGGTGRPFLTTDTAAVIRALEVGAQALLKGSDVAGVYDRDPHQDAGATLYEELRYDDVIARGLAFMDPAAAALGREYGLPTVVFNLYEAGNAVKIVRGEKLGTLVR